MPRGNHDIGKAGEAQTWAFLEEYGYIRPSKEQRIEIRNYYEQKSIEIDKSGFDVILKKECKLIGKKEIQLFEVKTTGKKRGESIQDNFIGLGFTLTEKEYNNAISLGKLFRFIFVNLATKKYRIFSLEDFFNNDKARIYKTWSIFIKNRL